MHINFLLCNYRLLSEKGEAMFIRSLLCMYVISFQSVLVAADLQWQVEPEDYDQHATQIYNTCMKYVQAFDLASSHGSTVVELGCNTARVSHALAQRYPQHQFVGIDPSAAALACAIQKYHDQPNLRFIQDAAQTYDLNKEGFGQADLVACYHVMHWIQREQLPNVFQNIATNLAPNGILDISTSAQQETSTITCAVRDTFMKPKWWLTCLRRFLPKVIAGDNVFTLLTADELAVLAEQAGLQIQRCEKVEERFNFDSRQEFKSFLHVILQPHGIKEMDAQDQNQLLDEVVERYCNVYNPAEDRSKVEHRFFTLRLTASKIEQ